MILIMSTFFEIYKKINKHKHDKIVNITKQSELNFEIELIN